MKQSVKARILSLLLVLVMVASVLPMNAFATEAEEPAPDTEASQETQPTETEEAEETQETEEAQETEETNSEESNIMTMALEPGSDTLIDTMPLVSDKESTLAPGVSLHEIVAYSGDGERVEMYITVSDLNVDTVEIYANYKDNTLANGWGFQEPSKQAAAFEANHPGMDAVATINGSYYNLTTGEPEGVLVMEGVEAVKSGGDANSHPFFAILKDGTPYIGTAWSYDGMKDQVKEAIAGKRLLVWNGERQSLSYDYGDPAYKYPRGAVGITADNKVITLTADGYRSPYSDGTTLDELAQIMKEMGCVAAVQLDGGGSASISAKREGSDSMELISTPGDGGFERKVANSLVIVSTAAASSDFHHAVLAAENDYVTPGSTVGITVTGVSATGHNAALPADTALQVKDAAMGSIVDGKYVGAAGYVGDAVIQAVSGGSVIGETTVHVVIPTSVNFVSEKLVVKYGNTADLVMEASINDGLTPVVIKASDFTFTWSDATLGTVEGFAFKASDDMTLTASSVLTATLVHNTELKDTLNVTLTDLPDKPVVITDFEDQVPLYVDPAAMTEYVVKAESGIVDKNTGKVHSGDYAFKIGLAPADVDGPFLQGYFTGRIKVGATNTVGELDLTKVDLTNAQEFGMWIYIAEDSVIMSSAVNFTNSVSGEAKKVRLYDYGYASTEEGHRGWQYFSLDFDEINAANGVTFNDGNWYISSLYITESCTRRPDQYAYQYGYEPAGHQSVGGYNEFYVDDIVIEYLDLDVDREDPDFGTVTMSYGEEKNVEVKGQTIASNKVSFSVQASDESKLDANSAKAYIDGNAVTVSCDASGVLSVAAQTLADGTHSITFVVADEHGNTEYVTRQVVVAADSKIPTVTVKSNANNAKDNEVLLESLFWLDVEVDDIEKVKSIEMILNLDAVSAWELEGMELAYGFSAKYSVDAENNATITITKTGEVELEGHAVIAKLPIRVGGDVFGYYESPRDKTSTVWDRAALYWTPIDVRVTADKGLVTYDDGTKTAFGMENIDCDTELTDWPYVWAGVGYTHKHTETALADKAATCTENGYTGRTFCEVCNSVVKWGTSEAATGHDYVMRTNGVVQCSVKDCGKLFNGVFEANGKLYKDGVLAEGWVDGVYYYVDGEMITGIYAIDGVYYNFNESGTVKGKVTGLFVDPADNKYSYALLGVLKTGWVLVDTDWHYFDENGDAASGKVENFFPGVNYEFEKTGKLVSGVWVKDDNGSRYYYGPDYYRASGDNSLTTLAWYTIGNEQYCFDTNGYRLEGIQYIHKSTDRDLYWYDFGTTGAAKEMTDFTGFLDYEGQRYFIEAGVSVYSKGLFEFEGNYYYVNSLFEVIRNMTYHVIYTNGVLNASGEEFKSGKYDFDADGKMITDGVVTWASEKVYLVDGVPTAAGLIYDEAEGCYYYARTAGKIQTGEYTVYAAKTNGLLPAGTYDFGTDGKLFIETEEPDEPDTPDVPDEPDVPVEPDEPDVPVEPEKKNGFVYEDGDYYYYVDDVRTYAGLIYDETEGCYYYVRSNFKMATGEYKVYAAKTNGLLPAGTYDFGADGKLFIKEEEPEPKNGFVYENGAYYYYENDVLTYAGLIYDEEEGCYYYVRSNFKMATGEYTVYAAKTNGLLPAGTYDFGADGKLFITAEEKNGFVYEDGAYYYYEDGVRTYAGLIYDEEEGCYYYVRSNFKMATGEYAVYAAKTNGLLPAGTYDFGTDGKLFIKEEEPDETKNGFVYENGGYYYYVDGELTYAGLIYDETEGCYYYVRSNFKKATGEYKVYAAKTNGLLPAGTYDFGTDGKLFVD